MELEGDIQQWEESDLGRGEYLIGAFAEENFYFPAGRSYLLFP